jgi:hypothetical protein
VTGTSWRARVFGIALCCGCEQSPFRQAEIVTRNPGRLPDAGVATIARGDGESLWNERGEVLVATLANLCKVRNAINRKLDASRFTQDPVGELCEPGTESCDRCDLHPGIEDLLPQIESELPVYAWVTPPRRLRQRCAYYWKEALRWSEEPEQVSEHVSNGLDQWIGLDPRDRRDVIIEYWVDPKALFRPCIGDEIETANCPALGADASMSKTGPNAWRASRPTQSRYWRER